MDRFLWARLNIMRLLPNNEFKCITNADYYITTGVREIAFGINFSCDFIFQLDFVINDNCWFLVHKNNIIMLSKQNLKKWSAVLFNPSAWIYDADFYWLYGKFGLNWRGYFMDIMNQLLADELITTANLKIIKPSNSELIYFTNE